MAIGGEQIAQGIEAETKRIHLPPTELLDSGTVGPKAIGVARLYMEHHVASVAPLDLNIDVESML